MSNDFKGKFLDYPYKYRNITYTQVANFKENCISYNALGPFIQGRYKSFNELKACVDTFYDNHFLAELLYD